MRKKEAWELIIRYVILILLGANLWVFYKIFRPLTIYPVYLILNNIYGASVFDSSIALFGEGVVYVEIIEACIAGAAYYLLLILNLTTCISFMQRIKSILFLFGSFLVLNIIRIVIFAMLFVNGFKYFDLAHKAVWYAGSTIIVVVVWFLNVKFFKIKKIPVYSDIITIKKDIKNKGNRNKR